MNRKTIAKLLACATAIAVAMPLMADTETVDGITWNYTVKDGKAEVGIGDYDGTRAVSTSTTGAIAIPPTLGGKPVTSIRSYAFYRCNKLTSLTIPASVTSIGSYGSFYGCSGLSSVMIPAGVTSIGANTFYYCSGLTSVTIPVGVTSIGAGAFESCIKLTSVTIPPSVTNIGFEAFYNCRGLTSVTIPPSVTSIKDGAFQDCSGLTSVTIPASVTSIGYSAFSGCGVLTTVYVAIGDTNRVRGLLNDSGLDVSGITFEEVKMPDSVTPDPRPVTPGHEVIEASDVVDPYEAPKAVTLAGAVYDGNDLVGLVELKLGKVSKGNSKVSGTVTTLDGKKHAAKAVNVTGIDGTSPKTVSLDVKDLGKMEIAIGGTQFAGSLGGYHVQAADVGGNWTRTDARVYVDVTGASLPAGTVAELLPVGEPVLPKSGKWSFNKATTVKLSKDKSKVEWDTSKGKTNLSGLKFTYTPKNGTFKGSFKVYVREGTGKATKLKKYTVNVNGFVLDGVGYGKAMCKKPAAGPWVVTVE